MSETYTAWDGKQYPWPPPTGWYQDTSGRWWAPGTGPSQTNPSTPGHGASGQGAGHGAPAQSSSDQIRTNVQPENQGQPYQSHQNPAQAPHDPFQPQGGPVTGQSSPVNQFDNQGRLIQPGNQSPPNQAGAAGGYHTPNQFNPNPGSFQQPHQPHGGAGHNPNSSDRLPLILGSMVAVLLIAGATVFFLTRDGSDKQTATDTTTAQTLGAPTESTSPPETGANTDTTVSETTLDGEQAGQEYRDYLLLNGIIVDENVFDADTIGDLACIQAGISDEQQWETYLALTVKQTLELQEAQPPTVGVPLGETEIRKIWNGAVFYYCPEDATRLGITL